MNESLSNSSLFVKAAEEYMNAYLASLPDTGEYDHNFTPAFESLIEKLIRRFERLKLLRSIARKVAAVLLALSIGAGALVGLNAEVRAEVQRWIRSIRGAKIIYSYSDSDMEYQAPDFEITWLPENVEITDVTNWGNMFSIGFTDRYGSYPVICLEIHQMSSSTQSQSYATAESTFTELTINGMRGDMLTNNESCTIRWFDEQNGYAYSLNGNFDAETILHMAKGIKIK